ncbi:MAG: hypothetical protein MJ068_04765 [Clostridia bacterium]|nr:hypothetical protein [Clostridia bacterium]
MIRRKYAECKGCGNVFYPRTDASSDEIKFCPSCLQVKNCKIEVPNVGLSRKTTYRKAKKKLSDIAQCVEIARMLGLSYGQYMACTSAQIEEIRKRKLKENEPDSEE